MLQPQFPFLFTANASDKNMQLHGFTFSSVNFFAWLNSHTLVPFRCSLREHEDMKTSILPILQTYFVCSSICLWCNWASSLPKTMFFNQVFFFLTLILLSFLHWTDYSSTYFFFGHILTSITEIIPLYYLCDIFYFMNSIFPEFSAGLGALNCIYIVIMGNV